MASMRTQLQESKSEYKILPEYNCYIIVNYRYLNESMIEHLLHNSGHQQSVERN